MSLTTQISNLAVRVATECKSIRATTGDKTALTTTDKTSLVAAINELKAALSGAAGILDSAGAGDTSHTWSADKIVTQLAAVKSEILDGAPAAYDTLLEIANQLATDDSAIGGLLTAVGNRVAFDQAQTLTAPQKAQALANIGAISAADVGDVTTNFVTTFEAGLV
jgi:capsid protein